MEILVGLIAFSLWIGVGVLTWIFMCFYLGPPKDALERFIAFLVVLFGPFSALIAALGGPPEYQEKIPPFGKKF